MYGGQLLDAAGKRTYERSCPVRPAVHKQKVWWEIQRLEAVLGRVTTTWQSS